MKSEVTEVNKWNQLSDRDKARLVAAAKTSSIDIIPIAIIIVITIFIIIIIFILIIFLITVIILPCRVKVSSLMMSIGAKLDQVRSGRGVPHLDD